jgi:hypothetical protein
VPRGYEIAIMFAMVMPGVYWGFAFVFDGTTEILQETVILQVLAYFYGIYCFPRVHTTPLYAPLAILVHGIIDGLHHFRLHPTSAHVKACCDQYPMVCGCFDISCAVVMAILIVQIVLFH